MSENWHTVASVDQIDEDQPLAVKVDGNEIGIFKVNDSFYAIEDICPHAYALLTQGFIDGDNVECPLHEAVFHIPSGKCLKAPAERDLKTYPIRIEGNQVLIAL
ncbi:MAG: nitrite reductase small subunit NirD [Thiothrix sp.]|nr:MAG: nitrite reductase small subunit NirD [Thiothrix sp.]